MILSIGIINEKTGDPRVIEKYERRFVKRVKSYTLNILPVKSDGGEASTDGSHPLYANLGIFEDAIFLKEERVVSKVIGPTKPVAMQ